MPLDAEFRHDLDAMAAAVTPRTRLVFVCSPNNPTGTVVTRDELERFLAAVGPDVLVALDEAYHEYVTDPAAVDGLPLLDAHPNLVVLRTFSKAYRLAGAAGGLRGGRAGGRSTALRKVCAPFSVNTLAQAAADRRARRRRGAARRPAPTTVDGAGAGARRAARRGLHRAADAGELRVAGAGERTAAFAAHCMEHKVVVRPFAADGCRVTVSSAEENDAVPRRGHGVPGYLRFMDPAQHAVAEERAIRWRRAQRR